MTEDRPRPSPRPAPPADERVAADPEDEAVATARVDGPIPADLAEDADGDPSVDAADDADDGAEGIADDDSDDGAAVPSRSRSGLVRRALQLLSVLAVAAGVIVFVAAQRSDHTSAAGSPSAATADSRARLQDPSAAQAFVGAAVTEVVAVTQSDYRSLDNTLQAGLPVTTGSFRTSFQSALTGAGAQERIAKRRVTSVVVLASGIGATNASGTTAQVLVVARLLQRGTDISAGERSTVTDLRLTMVRKGQQYLISALAPGANAGVPRGTTGLADAAEAARSEVVDVLSYRRAQFTADLVRARTGATGTLLSTVVKSATGTLNRMRSGGYDLSGSVTAIAAQQVSDNAAVFLIAANSIRVADNGKNSVDSDGDYAVVVQRVSGAWLASSMTQIGTS